MIRIKKKFSRKIRLWVDSMYIEIIYKINDEMKGSAQ